MFEGYKTLGDRPSHTAKDLRILVLLGVGSIRVFPPALQALPSFQHFSNSQFSNDNISSPILNMANNLLVMGGLIPPLANSIRIWYGRRVTGCACNIVVSNSQQYNGRAKL